MRVKEYVIELPSWVRTALPIAVVAATMLAWHVARASLPNMFKDGDVLTAQAL